MAFSDADLVVVPGRFDSLGMVGFSALGAVDLAEFVAGGHLGGVEAEEALEAVALGGSHVLAVVEGSAQGDLRASFSLIYFTYIFAISEDLLVALRDVSFLL